MARLRPRWKLGTFLVAVAVVAAPLAFVAARFRQRRVENLRALSAVYRQRSEGYAKASRDAGSSLSRSVYEGRVARRRWTWAKSIGDGEASERAARGAAYNEWIAQHQSKL